MTEKAKNNNEEEDYAAFFIPAGSLIGFGLGLLFESIPAGMFIGLGVGFLLYGIVRNIKD